MPGGPGLNLARVPHLGRPRRPQPAPQGQLYELALGGRFIWGRPRRQAASVSRAGALGLKRRDHLPDRVQRRLNVLRRIKAANGEAQRGAGEVIVKANLS